MRRMPPFFSKSPRPEVAGRGPAAFPTVSAAGRPPVVELSGVSRTFGADPPVQALRAASLVVCRGEWVAIVGRSGSGKSTLLNIVGLLDVPTAGAYRLNGIDTATLSDSARSALRGRGMGFVFQAFHLVPFRTVMENVMMAELYNGSPGKGRRERALAALTRVGLAERADFLPTRLSGGERQRVAVARALVCRPPLLLCDEPTGNLDSQTADEIIDLLTVLAAEGVTILIITHDESVARRAQRVVRMEDGRLLGPEPANPRVAAGALR